MRVSVSGFHAWSRRGVSAKRISDHRLAILIREAHEEASRRYGYRRIHQALVSKGLAIGRNAVVRVMRRENISGRGITGNGEKARWIHPSAQRHRTGLIGSSSRENRTGLGWRT
jgi:putative transposase